MKLELIKQTLTRTAGRSGLILKKYSPEILMGLGVVGMVTSTVLACKATLKAEDIIEEAKEKMDKVHYAKEIADPEKYTEMDYKKDLVIVYRDAAWDFTKLYGPAVTLGLVSIGCMLGAHGIMRKRNLALVAAYKAVEKSFSDYRKRVVEELGTEKDRQFKYGIKTEKVTAIEKDENGKSKKVTKTVQTVDLNGVSQYARVFSKENSEHWSPTPGYSQLWIKCQQQTANDILHAQGHIFLNEVYDLLGFEKTPAGQVVGWVDGNGDGYVDFGIFGEKIEGDDSLVEERLAFINGDKDSVILDFNVDGIVYDLI